MPDRNLREAVRRELQIPDQLQRVIVQLNPEFVEAHYNCSQTKVSLSQIEGARYDLEMALKLAEKRECAHIKSNIQQCLRELINMD